MDQITKILAGLSLKQKISIAVVLLIVGGGLFALMRWRHESDFRPLYSSMAPEDAALVVQKLKESGVEYRLMDNGGAVLVPSAKLSESRLTLASAGLPKSGRIGFELFDKTNFGATELVEHVNYQRALEGELERSIMTISEVEQARVHITLPKESVFLDQQEPSKASIIIKLRAGTGITPQSVVAVCHLVASAVPGLQPDAVSVLDTDGRLLSRPARRDADGSQITSETMELRQALERDLVTKINTTLEPLLGADRFRAGAFIDCDLTSAETQEESFDPTKSVMSSSQKTDDVTDRASTSGIPGTASNLPRAPAPTPGSGGEVSRRTENVQYETSRIVRKTRIPQGLIKRMSLSVLVGQEVKWQGEGKSKHKVSIPPDPETLKTIRELVAGVTGFDEDRGDQLIVDSLPFENNLVSEPVVTPAPTPKSPKWMEVSSQYWQYVLLGVLGLVVVTVMLGAVKGRKKTAVESVEAQAAVTSGASKAEVPAPDSANAPALTPAEEKENESILGKIRLEAQKEPAVAANVLRAWMKE